MTRAVPFLVNGRERAEYGCIVTFENTNGQRLVLHRTGPPMEGLRAACAIALSHDDTFRVISYSTPESVFTDLQGARGLVLESRPEYSNTGSVVSEGPQSYSPEASALGKVGLQDLLHPRLQHWRRESRR